jgi:putative colanic acid biosynthesis glycosyltransferase
MNSILISIITICRNNPYELKKTIESYHGFLNDSVECIIIDGSDDLECFNVAGSFSQVQHVKQSNSGIYGAMNEGIDKSNGLSLVFMNSGDELHESFDLSCFASDYKELLSQRIIFGDSLLVYKSYKKERTLKKTISIHPDFWNVDLPSHQSVFCPKLFLEKNKFDESKKVSSDSELLIKAFENIKFIYIENIISRFELGGVSSRPVSLFQTINHCNEVINTRLISKPHLKIKLYFNQIIKIYLIKLVGYERYLRMTK